MKKLIAMLLLVLAFPAFALEPNEALNDPAHEAQARALMAELRCLVCQSESIEASPSPFAAEVRALVREQIATGRSDAEIKNFLTARYGDAILYRPRMGPATWMLWLGPFLVLGLGMIAVVSAVQRARVGTTTALSPEEQAALSNLLQQDDKSQP